MYRTRIRDRLATAFVVLAGMGGSTVSALEIEPGVGAGLEYTNNAALTSSAEVSDVISISYVGVRVEENSGPVHFDAAASLNHHDYKKDAFNDEQYFNLSTNIVWEMVRNRFDWQLKDYFTQRSVISNKPDTPDNLQDTNIFSIGPNILLPLSGRQTLILKPEFQRFYYEVLSTDNNQSSLTASWLYSMYRTTSVGVNISMREINYDEPAFADNEIGVLHLVLSGKLGRTDYSLNLGTTRVDTDGGSSLDGVTGNINWTGALTAHSEFRFYLASDLTDSSSSVLRAVEDPATGTSTSVQIATDAIKDRTVTLGYLRQDASLKSNLWAEYRDLDYSVSLNDRRVKAVGMEFNYPLTSLLSSSFYARHYDTSLTDDNTTNKKTTVGGNLSYRFSRKLSCLFDLQQKTKDSSLAAEAYDDFRAYFSLVYGYGGLQRPGQAIASDE